MNNGLKLLMMVWPYMIYNSTYMPISPTIILLKEIPKYKENSKVLIDWCNEMLKQHREYIAEYGDDMPYIKNWKWDNNLIKKQ